MARFAQAEIERLKSEVSVERLIEHSGIVLKKAGKDLIGCCPFHDDSTASLVVTPVKNLWHCFGCGAAGGVIDWVIKKNGVSFRHAVELLRDGVVTLNTNSSLVAGSVALKRATVRVLDAPIAFDADDQALLNQVVDYYHDTLKQAPEVLAYLESRGFSGQAAMEAITTFKLGYANRTLGLRLPQKNRVAGADIRAHLIKVGLYRDSGHEHFNGSLIIPILDANGNVLEIYGRKLLDNLRAGTPKHLYLPSEHRADGRGVFNLAALTVHQEIILCEALIDALTFWVAGYRNVTASYGIEGFTDDMLAAFKTHGTQRVLIAYDRDEAGERGAQKVAEQLMQADIACFRIQFPKGMDANDYALKVTPAAKSLGVVIRKALWLGQGAAPTVAHDTSLTIHAPDKITVPHALAAEQLESNVKPNLESDTAPSLSPPLAPLPASPMPDPAPALPVEVKPNEILLTLGTGTAARRYRVRGLAKNLAVDVLKVNLLVTVGEDHVSDLSTGTGITTSAYATQGFHVDTLDLYSAKQRSHYLAQAAIETGVDAHMLKADLGRVLLALEQLQDQSIDQTLQAEPPVQMSEDERQAALRLLKAPDLIARILADFDTCGLVGETTNKLVGYLAAVSRKLDRPLGIVIQSSSAAGKTSLMDAVLAFIPESDKVKYSAMTGQSLYYMGETNLKHKVLAIVEEEGASRAGYALKLLQSEGELTMASTGKDPVTGNLITQQYRVEGPVALLLTTTARDLDEELMNRCLVLTVDEGRAQTRAIHQLQRDKRTLAGLVAQQDKAALITLHQNAQHLLKPLAVLNPYAAYLSFPDQTTRLRRDHDKYLTLIDTIAYLHQYQRPIKTARHAASAEARFIEYIEVTLDDIALANQIAHEVLGRSLDALPPQTRRLLTLIDGYVSSECQRLGIRRTDLRFTRRSLREAIHWGDTQLKVHLARLTELEYLITHRTNTNGFAYELVYDTVAESDTLHFPGLTDITAVRHAYDARRSDSSSAQSATSQGVVGSQSVTGHTNKIAATPISTVLPAHPHPAPDKMQSYPRLSQSASYAPPAMALAAATQV